MNYPFRIVLKFVFKLLKANLKDSLSFISLIMAICDKIEWRSAIFLLSLGCYWGKLPEILSSV